MIERRWIFFFKNLDPLAEDRSRTIVKNYLRMTYLLRGELLLAPPSSLIFLGILLLFLPLFVVRLFSVRLVLHRFESLKYSAIRG